MLAFTLKLLIAHIIGDFVLQPNTWISEKKRKKHKSKYLYYHILVHTIALLLLLKLDFSLWPYILMILLSHFVIDLAKLYLQNSKNERRLFFIDQGLHLSVIGLVVDLNFPFSIGFDNIFSGNFLLTLLSILMLTSVTSVVIKTLMSKWQLDEDQPKSALKNAGAFIGILERLFIFLFIVLGHWSAIGFLITAKSVFRFGDLSRAKDRKLTEYILIGTLLSFLIAIVIGLGYKYLITI
ncbi:DUF3307 domain-containing protein [Flavobacterium sp. CS20]|uniref:DUF3307 domain-containing protein n=1 Tax=Flavobacterium sp. CS20 TaxID=2775246 RepID=UPI001B39EBA1|nr:DUF3307 domain-containing protein [Flavobacterium sp. CS20]QTY26546.1 DUF3307 domain-containing protein [Flavobacterium sp. CS20]